MNRGLAKRVYWCGIAWGAGLMLALVCGCSHPTVSGEGGGTRGGNPVVAGTIIGIDGDKARNVKVSLIPADFDPMSGGPLASSSGDTTDIYGAFEITAPDSGVYNIEAVDMEDGARLIRFNIRMEPDGIIVVPADTLHIPGTVRVVLKGEDDILGGYLYVPGTHIMKMISDTADTTTLDSVPVGILPVLYHVGSDGALPTVVRYVVSVKTGATTLISHPQWSYARRIGLNTSSSGAGVAGDVYDFPVLVRLTNDNFNFTQARPDGSDLMFTGADGVLLPCEKERWDAAAARAEIWVKVDTIRGDDSDQSIAMYWGNNNAPAQPGGGVFDTADGFQGVWHMGGTASDSIRDATGNRYHGTSPATARPQIGEGVIGQCREFEGVTDYITMPNTATGKLDFPQNGRYSVSAWVMADTFIDLQQTLVSKGKYQYFLWMDSTSWQFWEFQNRTGWETTAQQATIKKWVLLTGVRDGNAQYLYVNGEPADSVSLKPDASPRNTASDLILGRAHDAADGSFFRGGIDEVRVESTVRSNDWRRLIYMNQRTDDRLVIFK